jgi:hypothetical protein
MLVIYRERGLSYDIDWLQAFQNAGASFTEYENEAGFHDLTVILHSVTAQWGRIPDWIYRQAEKRKGKLLLFLGNEFKNLADKNQLAKELGVDAIATQLPAEAARKFYTSPVLEVAHALNPDFFYPRKAVREFDVGVRGYKYPDSLGDNDRNRICDPLLWDCLRTDIVHGKEGFLPRLHWVEALSNWRAMPSTEGGLVGAKCITSRHFDAIGTKTCLVMYPGFFNGILTEKHYIKLEPDHSNLVEVKARILDEAHCEALADEAREYLCDSHTHAHRIKSILAWAEK